MDDFFEDFSQPGHPAWTPPPDYHSPGASDWRSVTPESPISSPPWVGTPTEVNRPLMAHVFGDTVYNALHGFYSWFQSVRRS